MNTPEQIVINRQDLKRIHDLRLAEIHKLREMLNLPPLMTGKQERIARRQEEISHDQRRRR